MKRFTTIFSILILLSAFTFGQNEQDALRYSQNMYNGSARFMSMGGAFGALGADISSTSINPAGIALYRKSEFAFSTGFSYNAVESNYLGSKYTDGVYEFNLNNIGFVGSFSDGSDQGWVSTSLAFGYNKLKNFDEIFIINGTGSTSLLDSWVNNVNAGYIRDIEQMALDAGLIYNEIDDVTLDAYINDFDGTSYGQLQRKTVNRDGGMGEYFISFAANYEHKFYVGGGINFPRISFSEHSEHYENDPDDIIPYLGSFTFDDHLEVSGRGFNLNLGFIYKPVQAFRIGASIYSPTFFDISEEYYSELESSIDFGNGMITDAFKTQKGRFSYELTTPFRATGSMAFVFKKIGLISVDYDFVDYTKARLRENSYSFVDENENISNRYDVASNIRVGAEVRTGPISIRGGYALYGSPYANNEPNKNANTTAFSAGLGTRGNSYFFDLAYIYTMSDEKYFLYGTEEASLSSTSSQIIATLGFRF